VGTELTVEVTAAVEGAKAPPSKDNFLDHVKWLRAAVQAQGAELLLAGDSLDALIRRGARHWVLHPQFAAMVNGVRCRTPVMTGEVMHFAGWLPYRDRLGSAARDKLVFKRMAALAGLHVPDFSLDTDAALADVVVKRAGSSSGGQTRGPFRSSAECGLNLAQGEYYEQFIPGDRLRLWCWNGEPLCVEVQQRMPGVERHGVAMVRNFAAGQAGWDLPSDAADLPGSGDSAWAGLAAAGHALWKALSHEVRRPTLFTVDAIRGTDHRLCYLDMDSLPEVHPLAYPAVVTGLLGTTVAPAGANLPRSVPTLQAG
jgi:hypothetical protein